MSKDFEILGIAETQDPESIKKALRARDKALHPDLVARADPAYDYYYRTAMGFFMRIHPSRWNLDPDVPNTRIVV